MKLPWMTEAQKFAAGGIVIWLLFAIAMFFLYMQPADASVFGYQWVQGAAPIKDSAYVQVDGKYIDWLCHAISRPVTVDERFYGCVQRFYNVTPWLCVIYGTWEDKDVPDWFWEHERHKHCELGLNHP